MPARPVLLWVSWATCRSPDSRCRAPDLRVEALVPRSSLDFCHVGQGHPGKRPGQCCCKRNVIDVVGSQALPTAGAWRTNARGHLLGMEPLLREGTGGGKQPRTETWWASGRRDAVQRVEAGRSKSVCGRSVSQGSSWAGVPLRGTWRAQVALVRWWGGDRVVLAA